MSRTIEGSDRTVLNICGCGRLHLAYGPVTLHFEPGEFLVFAAAVGRMASHLKQGRADEGPFLMTHPSPAACQ